jgi:hypothetical protein
MNDKFESKKIKSVQKGKITEPAYRPALGAKTQRLANDARQKSENPRALEDRLI